jgi:hypothetical protein
MASQPKHSRAIDARAIDIHAVSSYYSGTLSFSRAASGFKPLRTE